jgi:hypothetical protein|tara:strand:+ start:945 stop:1184 length:240 start_codon:yes stop_codon:yes gene_type:complete
MSIKIEKNVPLTKSYGTGKWSIVYEMEEGDSILCKDYQQASTLGSSIRARRDEWGDTPYTSVKRKQEDGTVRVWLQLRD